MIQMDSSVIAQMNLVPTTQLALTTDIIPRMIANVVVKISPDHIVKTNLAIPVLVFTAVTVTLELMGAGDANA